MADKDTIVCTLTFKRSAAMALLVHWVNTDDEGDGRLACGAGTGNPMLAYSRPTPGGDLGNRWVADIAEVFEQLHKATAT